MPGVDYSAGLERVLDLGMKVGEGPMWDDATSTLIFVESFGGVIYRYDPVRGALDSCRAGQPIGAAILRKRGGFVVSGRDGLLALDEGGGAASLLVPIERDLPRNRMNDAKCDSRGRLWSGTLSIDFEPRAGAVYRVDPDLTLHRVVDNVYISNGIAWSPSEHRMYYIDTSRRGIDVFDYDIETGAATNRRRLINVERSEGLPDGLTVDEEGCLWIALYCGSAIRRYSPDGEWIGTITLPAKGVTSCAFGGDDLRDLYITTATHIPSFAGDSAGEGAGALYRCRVDVRGTRAYRFGG